MRFKNIRQLPSQGKDTIAKIVLERLQRAADYKNSVQIFQNKSFYQLAAQAERQYRREYDPADKARLEASFGHEIKRYYGLTQIKTNATKAWKRDLVINNFDSMFTTFPTPEPELDEESILRVREQAERKLYSLAVEAGVLDLNSVMGPDGKPDPRFVDFMRDQVVTLKKEERARLQGLSMDAAKRAKSRLTDLLVQSNFRQVYGKFTHDQVLYGMGFMKFPDYRRIQTIKHQGGKVVPTFETVPLFRSPSVFNMFPVGDAADLQSNTANIEITDVTKIDLIRLIGQEGYEDSVIEEVLDLYTVNGVDQQARDRNWLGLEVNHGSDEYTDFWGPDSKIPMVIHEGFLTGRDLSRVGITGFKDLDVVNATVIVVAGYTIRCSVSKSPKDFERSYFAVPFNRFGDGIWDVLGMGTMLHDTEERINIIMNLYEDNMDWVARPPLMINPDAFANEADASNVRPGGKYKFNTDSFGDKYVDPLRPMNPKSAQYQLLFSQITQLLRQADEECGVPAFAYSSQDFGRSSLGEYSQRMSNALRTIKDAALEEDNWLIEPAWEGMFNRIMQQDPDLAVGQDVKMQVRGITGLLKDDLENTHKQNVLGQIMALSQQRPDLVPDAAVQYSIREFLEDAGFPVDMLGMDDPTIKLAIANAASNPAAAEMQKSVMQSQVPKLDGRSGPVAQGAVANSNGTTTY